MTDERIDSVGRIIASPQFQELLRRARRAPIIRRELTSDLVPNGITADETWELLTQIRRGEAYFSPSVTFTPEGVRKNWHTIPESLHLSLRRISSHTQQGSSLDSIVEERSGQRFITQQYVEEMLTNLRLDGRLASYEDIRAVLREDRPALTDTEQLAANFHRIMWGLPRLKSQPFDTAMLRHFYEQLTEGVSDTPLDFEQRSPLTPYYELKPITTATAQQLALASVVAIGNDRLSEPTQHPIMTSFLVNCQFWRAAIFPRYNNLMGCIASRFYLLKAGYQVFRYVPKVQIITEWRSGLQRGRTGYAFDESIVTRGLETDWTAYYDTVMDLLLNHVLHMEASLAVSKSFDDEVIACIASLEGLNYRQREVLRRAVLDPDMAVRINSHQKEYGVAYATARADLERLVDLGFLNRGMNRQAYEFRPTRQIKDALLAHKSLR